MAKGAQPPPHLIVGSDKDGNFLIRANMSEPVGSPHAAEIDFDCD